MVSLLFFLQMALAAPEHKVQMVKGDVFDGGKKLSKGSVIQPGAKIEAKAGAVIFIRLGTSQMLARFSGPGSFQVDEEEGNDILQLFQGTVRVKNLDAKGREKFRVQSNTAVVGVRGTDFFFNQQPLLGEAEIVVFTGKIEFTSASDPTDTKTIEKGYWGGVGGRFGKKIGELIKLTPEVLKHFDKNLSWL